jgi:hypothetical protein
MKMTIDYKQELKLWLVYFATIFLAIYIHEIGHCIPAWFNGYSAIPTPAKEYISDACPTDLIQFISLAGIEGTVLVSLSVLIIFLFRSSSVNQAILAGSIVMPGAYSLRFLLAGRGHDATEFQEAQAAMGFSYSGHSLDWIFVAIFFAVLLIWIAKSRPTFKISGRLLIGFVLTIIFIIGHQVLNNAIFDRVFMIK